MSPTGSPQDPSDGWQAFAPAAPSEEKNSQLTQQGLGCLVLIGLVILVGVCSAVTGGDDGGSGGDSGDEKEYAAFEICKDFVKRRLKSPSTAEFRNYFQEDGEVRVSGVGDGPYVVSSTVDSENSFGGKIRSSFVCTVTNTAGENWRLNDMQFVDGGG